MRLPRKASGRTILLVLGAATLALGIAVPWFQDRFLSAASDLGVTVLFAVFVYSALLLGVGCLALGLWRSETKAARTIRVLWGAPSTLLVVFLVCMIANMAWTSFIGPRATIVLPEGYSGRFTLTIGQMVEPSLATRGQTFTYEIPTEGSLHVDQGWIYLRFAFEKGLSVPGGPYYVQILRRNQGPLASEEFNCDWLYHGGSSPNGIECEIKNQTPRRQSSADMSRKIGTG